MKRKNIILTMLVVFAGLTTMQSCSKDESPTPTVYHTFSVPVATSPANEAVIAPATTTDLTWSATGGAAVKWDVYFGTDDGDLPRIAENHTTQTINVPVAEGNTYYWQLVNVDEKGIKTTSPMFSFTVSVNMAIVNFVGAYDCDEPGYAVYTVNLTQVDANTILNDNFWDSGWPVNYQFDNMGNVNIIPVTFKTSATTTYTVTGDGTYDNTTGEFAVHYVVTKKVYTLKLEGNTVVTSTADDNVHTFTKKVVK